MEIYFRIFEIFLEIIFQNIFKITHLLLEYYVACLASDIICSSPVVFSVVVFHIGFAIDQFKIGLARRLHGLDWFCVDQCLLLFARLVNGGITLEII